MSKVKTKREIKYKKKMKIVIIIQALNLYIYINSRIYIVWSKIVNRLGFRRQNYLLYTMMIMLDIHDYGALF